MEVLVLVPASRSYKEIRKKQEESEQRGLAGQVFDLSSFPSPFSSLFIFFFSFTPILVLPGNIKSLDSHETSRINGYITLIIS